MFFLILPSLQKNIFFAIFPDSILPEVNYTGTTNRNRVHMNTYHQSSTLAPNSNHIVDSGNSISQHNPKNPVFVPSPVSSNASPTMYNMDQMTNNIAIPKHTLPNPSNLATSRSTIVSDDNNGPGEHGSSSSNAGGRKLDSSYDHNDHENPNNHDSRYNSNNFGSNGYNNHLDENGYNRGGDAGNPYGYDDEDPGFNEDKNYNGNAGNEAQGKRGIWKESGQSNPSDSNGNFRNVFICPKYVSEFVCTYSLHEEILIMQYFGRVNSRQG